MDLIIIMTPRADNKTQEPRANKKTQAPSRRGSNSRMIIEMSAGNLAMMVRRKTHLPRSDLLNQMLTANCVVTSAVRGWGRNEVLRVDFAAFNQQADNGDVH
ncbi:unnamed protein product [Lepidochelys kempii]